jgi:hypothetical protein
MKAPSKTRAKNVRIIFILPRLAPPSRRGPFWDKIKWKKGLELFKLDVHCCAGYRGETTPRAFSLGTAEFEVAEVIDQWLAPDHRYFKVRAQDGGIYILRYDTYLAQWDLTFFTRSNIPDPSQWPPSSPAA